jgi:hypothetical protein
MTITTPLAALTLMMWIIWSDSVRKRRSSSILYGFRAFLYLAASAVLIYELWRERRWISHSILGVTLFAVVVGITGALYFFRKAQAAT